MVSLSPYWNKPSKFWFTVALLYAGSCLSTDQYESLTMGDTSYQQLTTPVVTSENDQRSYLGLRLANQLDVLLVSDPEADQAAAAMSVGVGVKSQPKSLPGLPHFLEHLLFMGNEKYPDENDYDKYLKGRSGFSNAYTAYEETNYFFGISKLNLEGGLDRFSQFFVAPLFNQNSMEREARSVDSEYKMSLQNDLRRVNQVKGNVSNPDYPYSNFGVGSYETLITIPKSEGVVTRDVLIEFYKQHYSSDRMKLVVIGKESLSELKKMVIPRFSKVPNRNTTVPLITGTPFTEEFLGIQINVVPVSDTSVIDLEFLLPSQKKWYLEKPTSYIEYLLGHEGDGSLTSRLRQLGWIYSTGVRLSDDQTEFAIFSIGFELTPLGLNHTNEIMKMSFSYIGLLQNEGVSKDRFDEIQAVKEKDFRYISKQPSYSYAPFLSTVMQSKAPLSQVITAEELIAKFNVTLIKDTLNFLNPNNMRVMLVSPEVAHQSNLMEEPYFGTKFNYEKIPESTLKELSTVKPDDNLHLPDPNPFLPKNFTVIKSSSKFPELIYNTTGKILWHTNGDFDVPKVSLNLLIKNNQWFSSPENSDKLDLSIRIIKENLKSVGFIASKAGLSYTIESQYPGIAIFIDGFSDKASKFMETIIDQLSQPHVTSDMFKFAKEKLIQDQRNQKIAPPAQVTSTCYNVALKENEWTNEQYLNTTTNLTMDNLVQFQRQDMANGNLELLVVGNFDQSQSKSLLDKIKDKLNLNPIPQESEQQQRVVSLKDGQQMVYQSTLTSQSEINSAIMVYFDMFSYPDLKQRATVKLIGEMIRQPMFDQLRTKEQLGYIVIAYAANINSQGGIAAMVQSERDPIYLESRIESFLAKFIADTSAISEEEFRLQVESLQSKVAGRQKDTYSRISTYWSSVTSGYYDFHRDETLVNQLSKLTRSDLIETVQTMASNHPKRRKLSIHAVSTNVKREPDMKLSDCGQEITDILNWRKAQTLSPLPVPLE